MIEVNGLSKRYGSTVAVDALSFDVRPGTVTGFLGPNGSGKTIRYQVPLYRQGESPHLPCSEAQLLSNHLRAAPEPFYS